MIAPAPCLPRPCRSSMMTGIAGRGPASTTSGSGPSWKATATCPRAPSSSGAPWPKALAKPFKTLPEQVREYLELVKHRQHLHRRLESADASQREHLSRALMSLDAPLSKKRRAVQEHLKALGNPPTKLYVGQLPLFPMIF